jgi:Tfp pilus assembly protein PilP
MMTLLLALALLAQTPATPVAPPAQPPGPNAPPSPPPNFSYAPDGRRDPFVSLINRGTTDARTAQAGRTRPEGIPGIMVEEVVVKGILQTRGAWVAMIAAPNGRTYTIRAGDRLLDGSVRNITAQVVILSQDVNDPLSLEKQREVRKYLRGEAK